MAKRKAISLSNELRLLILALDGVRAAADHSTEGGFDDRTLPRFISASLVVLIERLKVLDRVARDAVDPKTLWCDENDVMTEFHVPGEEDVVFNAWSDKKCARRYARESNMATRRVLHAKERRERKKEGNDG